MYFLGRGGVEATLPPSPLLKIGLLKKGKYHNEILNCKSTVMMDGIFAMHKFIFYNTILTLSKLNICIVYIKNV